MLRILTLAASLSACLTVTAFAETHEVQMLNRGEGRETMVFSPSFLRVAPGDTVKFVATDRGHTAESDDALWPEGVELFQGKINEEVEVTFEREGLYGVRCKPHYAMGMVMTVAVGDLTEAPEGWLDGKFPRRTKNRYEAQLEHLTEVSE